MCLFDLNISLLINYCNPDAHVINSSAHFLATKTIAQRSHLLLKTFISSECFSVETERIADNLKAKKTSFLKTTLAVTLVIFLVNIWVLKAKIAEKVSDLLCKKTLSYHFFYGNQRIGSGEEGKKIRRATRADESETEEFGERRDWGGTGSQQTLAPNGSLLNISNIIIKYFPRLSIRI